MSAVVAMPDRHGAGVGGIDTENLVRIPPGQYELKFDTWETSLKFGRQPKLYLWFTVASFGPHFEARLPRYYNVTRIIGRPSHRGRFKVGPRSAFAREFVSLCGSRITRLDRFPMTVLEGVPAMGEVVDVTHSHDQTEIPDQLRYSRIKRLFSGEK